MQYDMLNVRGGGADAQSQTPSVTLADPDYKKGDNYWEYTVSGEEHSIIEWYDDSDSCFIDLYHGNDDPPLVGEFYFKIPSGSTWRLKKDGGESTLINLASYSPMGSDINNPAHVYFDGNLDLVQTNNKFYDSEGALTVAIASENEYFGGIHIDGDLNIDISNSSFNRFNGGLLISDGDLEISGTTTIDLTGKDRSSLASTIAGILLGTGYGEVSSGSDAYDYKFNETVNISVSIEKEIDSDATLSGHGLIVSPNYHWDDTINEIPKTLSASDIRINAVNVTANGVSIASGLTVEDDRAYLEIDNLSVSSVVSKSDTYSNAYGIQALGGTLNIQNVEMQSITADQAPEGYAVGIDSTGQNTQVNVYGNVSISQVGLSEYKDNPDYSAYALASWNGGEINIGTQTNKSLSDKTVKIIGDFYTDEIENSTINTYLASSNSFISSHTIQDGGIVNISLNEGSTWYVPSDNTLSNGLLELNSKGSIILGYEIPDLTSAAQRNDYTKLEVQNLSSFEGVAQFQIDIYDETLVESDTAHLDQMSFDNINQTDVANSLQALITLTGDDVNSQNYTNHWFLEQRGDGSLTVTGHNDQYVYRDGATTAWQIVYLDGDRTPVDVNLDLDTIGSTSTGPGHWYLVRNEEELTPEVVDNITIGTSASQTLAYMADLEDLRKRIGEVRYGAQSGAWVKAFAKKDNVSASGGRGFEQDVYGINVGLDALAGTTESSSWLLGGAFRYARADQEGIGIGTTSGDLDEYSVKAYATWMHEKGSYADFVLQVGRYEQELSELNNTGSGSSHADYGTWGFGASVEVGHMFSFAEDADDRRWFNHFFIEPQLELSYFHARGADYSTSTGLRISQDDADFLTGRAGLVLGKKFNYGSIDELDRRFFQFALIGGVKHEFLGGDQNIGYTGVDGIYTTVHADDIDGSRFYYGLNFDWQISDSCRIFAQFDREEGDHYTKEYDVSIGAKWSF